MHVALINSRLQNNYVIKSLREVYDYIWIVIYIINERDLNYTMDFF